MTQTGSLSAAPLSTMVPLSTLTAGHRLMMHGLDCEALHGWLRLLKHRQAQGLSLDPRNPIGGAA